MSAYQVLDAAGSAGVPRIVYVSSLSALGFAYSERGASPERVPVTEAHPFAAEDVYGLSKHLGEQIARTVALRWSSAVVSLRFPFLGHGERLRRHLATVHADPGSDRRGLWSWLDTRDAARAVQAALTGPVDGCDTPFSTARSRELLGFTPIHGWRERTAETAPGDGEH